MRLAAILLAAVVAALNAGPALAAPTRIQGGFVGGEEYLDWPNQRKLAYVTGLLEGMLFTPKLGADPVRMRWLEICTDAIGRSGIRHALSRYLLERDQTWTNRNPAKMYRAIRAGCLKRPEHATPEARIEGGYITNKEYLDLDGLAKRAYAAGLIEGILLAPAFGARDSDIAPLIACVDRIGLKGVRRAISVMLLADSRSWPRHDPAIRLEAITGYCAKLDAKRPQTGRKAD
jgi:hypothetical protein